MIIEGLFNLLFGLITLIFELFSFPATPEFIVNVMDKFYQYTLDGVRFAQYFFAEETYSTFFRIFLVLMGTKYLAIVVLWLYDKIRGC